MKTINKIGLLLIFISLSFSSCMDDLKDIMYTDEFAKCLYLKNSGEENITLYKVSPSTPLALSVIKTGNDPNATAVGEVRMLTQDELDVINRDRGTNYAPLPSACYKLENTNLTFASSDQYLFPKLTLYNIEIDNYILTQPTDKVYVIPVGLFGEAGSINLEKNSCIYKPVVKVPSLRFDTNNTAINYNLPKAGGDIEVPLVFEIDANLWDFDVELEVDASSLADPSQLMSEDNYTLAGNGKVSFKKGDKKGTLTINVSEMKTTYGIIPLKIKQVSIDGLELDSRTIEIEVELRYPLTIAELATNAQEPSEGKLENILDKDINTYFHSAWSVAVPEKHYVQVNLNESMMAFAFTYTNRAGNGNAALNNFDVSISTDGVNFELLKNFTKDNDNLPMSGAGVFKSELLNFNKSVKYIRFTCNASGTNNNKYFVWSEFAIYDYK